MPNPRPHRNKESQDQIDARSNELVRAIMAGVSDAYRRKQIKPDVLMLNMIALTALMMHKDAACDFNSDRTRWRGMRLATLIPAFNSAEDVPLFQLALAL